MSLKSGNEMSGVKKPNFTVVSEEEALMSIRYGKEARTIADAIIPLGPGHGIVYEIDGEQRATDLRATVHNMVKRSNPRWTVRVVRFKSGPNEGKFYIGIREREAKE